MYEPFIYSVYYLGFEAYIIGSTTNYEWNRKFDVNQALLYDYDYDNIRHEPSCSFQV